MGRERGVRVTVSDSDTTHVACEQALLFGQAKRASRLASLAQIGELARRLQLMQLRCNSWFFLHFSFSDSSRSVWPFTREENDREISRLPLPTKFFPNSHKWARPHATPLVDVLRSKTPLLYEQVPIPKYNCNLKSARMPLAQGARHSRHSLKTMVAWPFRRSPVFQHGRRIRTKPHSDCL